MEKKIRYGDWRVVVKVVADDMIKCRATHRNPHLRFSEFQTGVGLPERGFRKTAVTILYGSYSGVADMEKFISATLEREFFPLLDKLSEKAKLLG